MTIKVKFFGSIRESVGQSNGTVDNPEVNTVLDVWNNATDHAPIEDNVFCAVNLEHREMDYVIKDGDEVAFFPPVTGG